MTTADKNQKLDDAWIAYQLAKDEAERMRMAFCEIRDSGIVSKAALETIWKQVLNAEDRTERARGDYRRAAN